MENDIVEGKAASVPEGKPKQPANKLVQMRPVFSQIGIIFGLAAVLALGIGTIMWSLQPNYTPIFKHLAEQDTALIADTLGASQIDYRIEPRTGLILVSAGELQKVRIMLAAEGLPQSAPAGFEMLQQEQGLGTSRFVEVARHQHALETELSRSISAMRNIESARVHLAMPKQSVFVRKRAKVSASVMVKLFPGRALDRGQVDSIVHLVASSVPYLNPPNVTVVDQWGRLLSDGQSRDNLVFTQKQFEYTRKLEQNYVHRIENLLVPIFGKNKIRTEINANLDFSQNESTREAYDDKKSNLRSEQIHDQETRGSTGAVGIPGALSNQPPAGGATNPDENNDEKQTQPVNTDKSATRNYELDKTITHTRHNPVGVKRLSVAVIVDDHLTVNEAGEEVRTPLTDEDIKLITGLVHEAIGFDKARGDTVAVYNKSFIPPATIEPLAEAPLWEQPWVLTLAKQLMAAVIVLLIIFMVVRPSMRALTAKHTEALSHPGGENAGPGSHLLSVQNGGLQEDMLALSANGADGAASGLQNYDEQLTLARSLARDEPKMVAKVMTTWVNENGE